jgi:hypothetical protein
MWCKALGLIATVITGALFGSDSTAAQTRIVTSDATAQFVPLENGKFIVINAPAQDGCRPADQAVAPLAVKAAGASLFVAATASLT